jgi:hypothetical protein
VEESKWIEAMKKARDLDRSVLPNRSARHLLLVISTYANGNGVAWPKMTTLARAMGFRLTDDGRLTPSASAALHRVLLKLKQCGLVERRKCDCWKERHPCHFQLDLAALWASDFVIAPITKKTPSDSEFVIARDNKTTSASDNKTTSQIRTPVRTTPSTTPIEHQLNGTQTTASSKRVPPTVARDTRAHEDHAQPFDARAIPEAADGGGTDDE